MNNNLKKQFNFWTTAFFALYLFGLGFVIFSLIFSLFIFLKDNLDKLEYSYFIGGIALTIALASFLVNYYKNFLDEKKREKFQPMFKVVINGLIFSLLSFMVALMSFVMKSTDNVLSKCFYYSMAIGSSAIFSLCFIILLIFFSINFYRDWKGFRKEISKKPKDKNNAVTP